MLITIEVAVTLVLISALLGLYALAGYPMTLWVLSRIRKPRAQPRLPNEWPTVSISLPVYNEESQIREVLDSLLAFDYPPELRQIVVISDASSDRTDAIVSEYADRGVELLRLSSRSGKTAAENAAASRLRGEIVMNTDASIRVRPDALRRLIAHFNDSTVGVASGRDVSVASLSEDANFGEAGYVGYEMRVRALETRVSGIIGASGCFYAIRSHLHREPLPGHLSRDFAAALIAREHGYRAVSVDDAVCYVPRTTSLKREYKRKVRTMSRGMETLAYKRHLLNPFRYGLFAWMLFSHKVCRWLLPVAILVAMIGFALLSVAGTWPRWLLAGFLLGTGVATVGWYWPDQRALPRPLALISALASVQLATLVALIRALHGDQNAAWEPTRRDATSHMGAATAGAGE